MCIPVSRQSNQLEVTTCVAWEEMGSAEVCSSASVHQLYLQYAWHSKHRLHRRNQSTRVTNCAIRACTYIVSHEMIHGDSSTALFFDVNFGIQNVCALCFSIMCSNYIMYGQVRCTCLSMDSTCSCDLFFHRHRNYILNCYLLQGIYRFDMLFVTETRFSQAVKGKRRTTFYTQIERRGSDQGIFRK